MYDNRKISHIRTIFNEDELIFIFDKNEELNSLTYDYGRKGEDWSSRVVKNFFIEKDNYKIFYDDPIKFYNKIKLLIELE
ncbi:MAG: hypothetical protein LC122_14305 [Chitinophagales bacterium]|nr:hypothetical protein [Chitinophagales bacterium]